MSTIERSLARFAAPYRQKVSALALRHPRLAELALTFPGLLFALATRPHGASPDLAITLVMRGARLKAAAAAAGVPLWLRHLPPEAFDARFTILPDGNDFACRIANHLPGTRKLAPIWLRSVVEAAEICDGEFAIWIARELTELPKGFRVRELRLLALYAWFSRRPGTLAHGLIERPWHTDLRLAGALSYADAWGPNVELFLALGNRWIDPWLKPATVMGYTFLPLCTGEEIAQEAGAMKNCLREYGREIAEDRDRFWSVRRDGERVATLSIGPRRDGPILDIRELRGHGNSVAPLEIWRAARQWLDQWDYPPIAPRKRRSVSFDRQAWIALWRPYWLARRQIPHWLPLAPSLLALDGLW